MNILYSLYYIFFGKIQDVVLFNSFNGQYNDNPKYISEKLFVLAPKTKIFWVRTNKSHEIFPPYVHVVNLYSKEYMKLIYTARVVVDNGNGTRSGNCLKTALLDNIKFFIINRKKKGQLNISTWHGTPLKRIAMDEPYASQKYNYYCCSNYILSGCRYTTEKLKSAFQNKVRIKEYGTPRNDLLVKNDKDKNEIRKKLGLPSNKKIILYAPTFRNNVEDSGLTQMKSIDFNRLHCELEQKFGDEWVFVYRVHNLVLNIIDRYSFPVSKMEIIDGNLHDDMTEYLYCCDILITDYSGSMFDFAITQKPCFLFTPDIDYYKSVERGFYMNIEDLPFPLCINIDELYNKIRNFNESEYKNRIGVFMKTIGNLESGRASEKVVYDILSHIKS